MSYSDPEYKKKHWAEYKTRPEVIQQRKDWRAQNKEHERARVVKWKADNKELIKQQSTEARLGRLYGMTLAQYEAMLTAQNNKCLVCGKPESYPGRRLAVDHCHTTNKVRGLLCGLCNRTLGVYERHKSAFDAYLVERG